MRGNLGHGLRLALAVAWVLIGAGGPLAAPAAGSPLRYVALGDSYSAASGVLPPDPAAPPQCLRSLRNYPHVIAEATGAQLSDVTCGAAETGDFFTSQSPGVPPQLDAVDADAQLVTMTIGGNDSGVFINAVLDCGAAGLSTVGQGSPCKDRYGSSFEDTIRDTTYPSLVRALGAVRAKAPDAVVAILGYPWIMPASGGCFPTMPVATGDVPYVRAIQATLNDAIRRAAAATGSTYVDFGVVSDGHDACQPIGVRWIEPALTGTNPVIVHPNALGEAEMAAQTLKVLGPALASPTGSGATVACRQAKATKRRARVRVQKAIRRLRHARTARSAQRRRATLAKDRARLRRAGRKVRSAC